MLEVGGLDLERTEHVDWVTHELQLGDRIELEIVEATRISEPVARRGPTEGVETLSGGKKRGARKPRGGRATARPGTRARASGSSPSQPRGAAGPARAVARKRASKRSAAANGKKRLAKTA